MRINNEIKKYKYYWQLLTILSTTSLTLLVTSTILGLIYFGGLKQINSGVTALTLAIAGIIIFCSRFYVHHQLKNKFPEN